MSIAGQYLRILDQEGADIVGESEGHGFQSQIDITSWDWDATDQSSATGGKAGGKSGADASGKSASAGGGESGVEAGLFRFTKAVDSSSTRLMCAMDLGQKLEKATFTLREEIVHGSGDRRVPFLLHVVLEDVYVVSYSLSGRSSEFRVDLDETWELHYSLITFNYESAGGMKVQFRRRAGSTKGSSTKPAADVNAELKKVREQLEKSKGKSGG